MAEISFKRAGLEDVDALQAIAIQTYGETFGNESSEEDLARFYQETYALSVLEAEVVHPESETYLVYLGEDLAAYLKVNWGDAQTEHELKSAFEIQRIYVLRAFQGQGLGKATFTFAMDRAYQSGLDWVWLGVWEFNYKAQNLYESFGFVKFSEHQFIVGEQVDTDWLLKKRLK
ncbi:GNAT family N-acetyltransferase [Streptococcus caballi]|uniref:GNAT family N-acetyltransferase n=1 Tax=Streptococcus caballi TaxID=439220 RepID=UPI00036340EA|nr:GNAT family N-acetyltransferase [Streptococcus caballi]